MYAIRSYYGSLEVIFWPELYAQASQLLNAEEALLIRGDVDSEGNLPKVIAQSVAPLAEAKQHWKGKVHIHIRTPGLEKETLVAVRDVLASHKGGNETFLHFLFP